MILNSPDFTHDGELPSRFTCDGENIHPALTLSYVPMQAKSLAIIVEDPDAPAGTWVHWMIWDVSADITEVNAGETPQGVVGKNSSFRNEWDGICPPDAEHRYFFKVFALDVEKLELDPETATREDFYTAVEEHIVKQEEIVGRYVKIANQVTTS